MKIMAVCGSGIGSSFMLEMNIKDVLKALNITDVEVEHTDLSGATPGCADIFIAGRDIAMAMGHLENVVVLNDILNKQELKEKIQEAIEKNS